MSKNKKLAEAKELYKLISEAKLKPYYYKIVDCGENVRIINECFGEWWKQRYLLDDDAQCAYEIMNKEQRFTFLSTNDINWESLNVLSGSEIFRAQRFSAVFPSFVRQFKNGVAEVAWQLNPDGHYYMDDDGFGMTDDEEITIYGIVDKQLKVIVKFQYIDNDWKKLRLMRSKGEKIVRQRRK